MHILLLRLFGLGWAMAAPEAAIPVRIDFEGPPGCSSADAFYRGVRARTDRVRRARAGERAQSVRVRVKRAGHRVHGELGGFDDEVMTETRVVDGASCDEVVQALSLTAALALDPNARFEPLPQVPDEAETPAGSSAGTAVMVRPREAGLEETPPTAPDREPPKTGRQEPESAESAEPFRFAFGVAGLAARVVTSEVNVGAGISARLTQKGSALLSPSFGLALLHLRNDLLADPDRLSVRWTSVALSACPVRFGDTDGLALTPCVLGVAGWINAEGENLSHPSSAVRSWWSLGGVLRASAAIGRNLTIELETGLTLPLVRRRFITTIPDEFIAETPDVAPIGGLGIVYGF